MKKGDKMGLNKWVDYWTSNLPQLALIIFVGAIALAPGYLIRTYPPVFECFFGWAYMIAMSVVIGVMLLLGPFFENQEGFRRY